MFLGVLLAGLSFVYKLVVEFESEGEGVNSVGWELHTLAGLPTF
jgi:hypothetical protein